MLIEDGEKLVDIANRFQIHINTIYSIMRLYKETGGFTRRPSSGTLRSTRTEEVVEAVRHDVTNNPSTSIWKLTTKSIRSLSMRDLIKDDLGMRSLVKRRIQQLTPLQMEKREDQGIKIINFLKSKEAGKVLIFSDEKDFHVDKHHNRRNSRYIAESPEPVGPEIRYVGTSKFPAKAMRLGYIGSCGTAFLLIWIEGTMDGPMYKRILQHKVLPLLDATYGKGNYVWTQDGASCHTSKLVQQHLMNRLGSRGFWSMELGPPNSPNLNPLDFSIWVHIEERACHIPQSNVVELKASIEQEWAAMDRDYIRRVCSAFRSRVEKMVASKGGVIEK